MRKEKTVTDPMELIAYWICARSMLESCELAAWLLETGGSTIISSRRAGREPLR